MRRFNMGWLDMGWLGMDWLGMDWFRTRDCLHAFLTASTERSCLVRAPVANKGTFGPGPENRGRRAREMNGSRLAAGRLP